MVSAAKTILDERTGRQLAWDAMMSPEARAAMARKALLEVGAELISTGSEGLMQELTQRKDLFETVFAERKKARTLLRSVTSDVEKQELRRALTRTDDMLRQMYRLQYYGPKATSFLVGIYTSEEIEHIDKAAHAQHSKPDRTSR